ncbi:hypothetical protein TNIN_20801 [Trichonephila inaurata madagascariensis]|uniref:Uncharacterized protein n=1 Tax=Trichonephila inaurata madagascariensis TaxID=2747483 RepID=A0A8X7CIJ4_9ARAC|nr:hypothetical protein TNIN_20801 [Trichonephila inaurata madagascariensis]
MVRMNHSRKYVSPGRKKGHRKELEGKMPFLIVVGPTSHQEKATCKPQVQQEESTLLYSLTFNEKDDQRTRPAPKHPKKAGQPRQKPSQGLSPYDLRSRRQFNRRQEQSRKTNSCSSRGALAAKENLVQSRQVQPERPSPYNLRNHQKFSGRQEKSRIYKLQPTNDVAGEQPTKRSTLVIPRCGWLLSRPHPRDLCFRD